MWGIVTLPVQVSQFEDCTPITRTSAFNGYQEPTRHRSQRSPSLKKKQKKRGCRAAALFPRTGFTRKVLDKIAAHTAARIHVTHELPEHRHDQALCRATPSLLKSVRVSEGLCESRRSLKAAHRRRCDLWRRVAPFIYRRDAQPPPRRFRRLIGIFRDHRQSRQLRPKPPPVSPLLRRGGVAEPPTASCNQASFALCTVWPILTRSHPLNLKT